MGLADYKAYKKRKDFLSFLEEYGISESDLLYLPKALEIVKGMNAVKKPSEEELAKIREANAQKMTPEKIVESFVGETQEFNLNGR